MRFYAEYCWRLERRPQTLRTINPQRQVAILKHLRKKPGAAFGATLYCDFVHFGAVGCNMGNESILFLHSDLFDSVQGRAMQFSEQRIGLKIRRPQGRGGSNPPPGTKPC